MSELYEELSQRYDILIVSPFADDPVFRSCFAQPRTSFLALKQLNPRALTRLYHLSESLRMHGFWFKYRKDPMIGYLWNQICRGLFVRENSKWRQLRILRLKLEGMLGSIPWLWRLVEQLFGRYFFEEKELSAVIASYDRAVFVQTASFGFQERYLSFMARKLGCLSMLIPYTTDQIGFNGYLTNCFDVVCPQGPMENIYLKRYQEGKARRVFQLGSIWFQNLKRLGAVDESFSEEITDKNLKVVMLAGGSDNFFDSESELELVDYLLSEIVSGRYGPAKLIYRPVVSFERQKFLRQRYAGVNQIELEFPDLALIGLTNFGGDPKLAALNLLKSIRKVDVFLMCGFTSLCLDFLYFKLPVLSFYDRTGQKFWQCSYAEQIAGDSFGILNSIPIGYSPQEISLLLDQAIHSPAKMILDQESARAKWDYEVFGYPAAILELFESL